MRWSIDDILGSYRNQWAAIEFIFQGERSERSSQRCGPRHIHFGAAIRFSNKTKETTEIDPQLQGIHCAIIMIMCNTLVMKRLRTSLLTITFILHSIKIP